MMKLNKTPSFCSDNSTDIISFNKVETNSVNLNELTAKFFCPGEFYFYLVDFSDRQIKFLHPSIKSVLGLDPSTTTFNDIINQIHNPSR